MHMERLRQSKTVYITDLHTSFFSMNYRNYDKAYKLMAYVKMRNVLFESIIRVLGKEICFLCINILSLGNLYKYYNMVYS